MRNYRRNGDATCSAEQVTSRFAAGEPQEDVVMPNDPGRTRYTALAEAQQGGERVYCR